MKKIIFFTLIALIAYQYGNTQQRITPKQVELLKKHLETTPLLKDDGDFAGTTIPDKWADEGAVILCQKTSFDFDKKGLSVGKRIGRNVWGVIFAVPTLGISIWGANATNDTKILIEERERRRILLKDKFAIEQYSILYFRLAAEGDAFAARVIKKDGSVQKLDMADAIRVEDIKSVPNIFRTYTDAKFSSSYRPDYFKLAVSDIEEGDIIEYEFVNFNNESFRNNPNYMEFNPVYYLCNRTMPVSKQIIEVVAKDEKYHIGYKSLKGAPDFVVSTNKDGDRIYKWEDNDRDRAVDTRFVNESLEMASVKFQMIYARNSSKNFIWFKDENQMKQDITMDELGVKAKEFWYQSGKLQNTGAYTAGLPGNIEYMVDGLYKSLKKKGVTEGTDDEYVRKTYYFIRSRTLYRNWSDYAFAKVFSGLLAQKKIPHEIVVTPYNSKTDVNKVAFTSELAWAIKYKNKYFINPDEHLNPEEIPFYLSNNQSIVFNYNDEKGAVKKETLPVSDTLNNMLRIQTIVSLDTGKINLNVERNVEARGLVKDNMIDDILALTPYMENDYKNYDGTSMWEGMDSRQEDKALTDFNVAKKEWKESKPKMMKAIVENDYNFTVGDYSNFKLVQDGRSYKKRSLQYTESFNLKDFTSNAGDDILVPLPSLVGTQTKVKKEERQRTLPVDISYPRAQTYNIIFTIPAGYTVKGMEALNKKVDNEYASFISTAKIENNTLVIDVKKVYKGRNFDAGKWSAIVNVLDAAYDFSQSKILLKKQQ